jgi:hypothetical protein
MKKAVQLFFVLVCGTKFYAQEVVLTNHFNSNPTVYQIDAVSPVDTGYISGTNIFMQKAKMQKFDSNFGITGSGSIKGVNVGIPAVGGAGEIKIEIYPDVNGQADFLNPLASEIINLSSINTAQSNFTQLGNFAKYNIQVLFPSPIQIPSNNSFWAGVVLPNPSTGAAILYTTNLSVPFTFASTHSGEIWANDSFHFMSGPQTWGLDLAFAIFPIVNFSSSAHIDEQSFMKLNIYPNPASNIIHIESDQEISSVTILSLDGKYLTSVGQSFIDITSLATGTYLYEVVLKSGKTVRGNFTKI